MTDPSAPPRRTSALAAAAALLALALGVAVWLATRNARDSASLAPDGPQAAAAAGADAAPVKDGRTSQKAGTRAIRTTPPDTAEASAAVAAIIGDTTIDDLTARNRLFALANNPAGSLAERTEALDHVLVLTPDTDSAALLPLASSAHLPAEIRSRLLDDAHNRSGKPQLQILLALLERADADQRGEVLELLRFLTNEDHGTDLGAWRVAVDAKQFPPP